MFSLKGKTILITGATSGIGLKTAFLLHELGVNLILLGRNKERLEKLKNLMPNQITIGFEMNQIERIVNLLKDISKEYGELQGLVHAAGIHEITPLRTVSISKTRELFSTNIETTIQLLKACSNKKSCRMEEVLYCFLRVQE